MKCVLVEVIEREISTPAFFDDLQKAREEMISRVKQAFGEENISFGEPDEESNAVVMETTAYGERYGQNFDWKIFEV